MEERLHTERGVLASNPHGKKSVCGFLFPREMKPAPHEERELGAIAKGVDGGRETKGGVITLGMSRKGPACRGVILGPALEAGAEVRDGAW